MPKPDVARARLILQEIGQQRRRLEDERLQRERDERKLARKLARESRAENERLEGAFCALLESIFVAASEGRTSLDIRDDVDALALGLAEVGFVVSTAEGIAANERLAEAAALREAAGAQARYVLALGALAKKLMSKSLDREVFPVVMAADLIEESGSIEEAHREWDKALGALDEDLVLSPWIVQDSWQVPGRRGGEVRGIQLNERDAKHIRPALVDVARAYRDWDNCINSGRESGTGASTTPVSRYARRISWCGDGPAAQTPLPVLGLTIEALAWISSRSGQAFLGDLDLTMKALSRTGQCRIVVRLEARDGEAGVLLTAEDFEQSYPIPLSSNEVVLLLGRYGLDVALDVDGPAHSMEIVWGE